MTLIVLLFAIGVLLIVLEVIVPGGVLGVIGALSMLGGCVLAFRHYGTTGGSLAVAGALAVLGLSLYLEFALLPRTRFGKKFFLQQAVDAKSQPLPADPTVVLGKMAEAATTMAPTGYVLLDGTRYEARSQSGLIAKGATVRIVGVDSFHLIVTQT
jgi:membrane-bound serine protease (ClpP class)